MNDRFNSFSQLRESFLQAPEDKIGLSDIDCRSEVLLFGAHITVRIQIFYHRDIFGPYLKNIYDNVTRERVVDFFNEVGNLTGGKVKEIFFEQGIVVALSLPISIETTKDNVLKSKEVLPEHKFYESRYKEKSLYAAKISIDVHSLEKFSSFDKNYSMSEFKDGDVEFF
ncbi:MAG: hypothetical protein ACXVCE_17340 [Bacteriovorax sp.]